MRILIIGAEGSMGKRYVSILDYLGYKYKLDYDLEDTEYFGPKLDYNDFDTYIIATPTKTHFDVLKKIKKYAKRILCEKPVTTDLRELKEILSWEQDLTMMMQYQELVPSSNGTKPLLSSYDYFRSGDDGIFWDCMQVIALHEGEFNNLNVKNESPVWNAWINSNMIKFSMMDTAYIYFIKKWLNGYKMEPNYIYEIHKKVIAYKEWYDQSHNRDSGEKHVD